MNKTGMGLLRSLNAFWTFILCFALVGAFVFQLTTNTDPCVLCMIQRACIACSGCGFLMNIVQGVKSSHYGLSLLSSTIGAAAALIQILLHACDASYEGHLILGYQLYTWSFLVFVLSIFVIAVCLMLNNDSQEQILFRPLSLYEKLCSAFMFLLISANALAAARVLF